MHLRTDDPARHPGARRCWGKIARPGNR